jgi:protein gp37
MGEQTGISWTDHTFNPWWGCHKVSPACDNCYAETWAGKFGVPWGKDSPRRFFGDAHWREPLKWNRKANEAGVQRFVFCASMADWAEEQGAIPAEIWAKMQDARARLFDLIEATPWLVWLLLTKRPKIAPDIVPRAWMAGSWPTNAWAGATMEDHQRVDLRAPALLRLPAPRRFASYEPALGPADFTPWLSSPECNCDVPAWEGAGQHVPLCAVFGRGRLDWVIYGGESGEPGDVRPADLAWARAVKRQCEAAGASFWAKQTGLRAYDSEATGPGVVAGHDARLAAETYPIVSSKSRAILAWPGNVIRLSDSHGSALIDLPKDLRVRQRPAPLPVRRAA